jgi:hypothetical protein
MITPATNIILSPRNCKKKYSNLMINQMACRIPSLDISAADECDHVNCKNKGNTHMSLCGRCRIAHYCSKPCQLAAWPAHKTLCIETSEESRLEQRGIRNRFTFGKALPKHICDATFRVKSRCFEREFVLASGARKVATSSREPFFTTRSF